MGNMTFSQMAATTTAELIVATEARNWEAVVRLANKMKFIDRQLATYGPDASPTSILGDIR